MKRLLLALATAAALLAAGLPAFADRDDGGHDRRARFELVEATIPQISAALRSHVISAERLTKMYFKRIEAYEDTGPAINAYIHINANAVREARQLDALRNHRGHSRMPLFGVPVLLKDNIDTADMPNTAGSVALAGSLPPDDAFISRKLRAAGAIILGKGTLTEYANFIAVGMPTGYSSLGGFGFNPYDPRVDPRTTRPNNDGRPVLQTGGSSSGPGIGVNANLVAIAVGTETSGSILSPASANGVVGIKPTVGLVSRDGIIPITADQDTAGPITRTVTDAAILLGVLAGYDPNDPATEACLTPGNCFDDYTRFLKKKALRGARLAVPPFPANRTAIMEAAIAVMRSQGAYVELIETYDARIGMPQLGTCIVRPAPTGTCSTVLLYGFKRDLNAYLAVTPAAPSRSLAEIIAFNDAFDPPMKYGQAIAIGAEALDTSPGSADTARYLADRAEDLRRSKLALDGVFNGPDGEQGTADDFDAVVHLGNANANVPAKAGYPSVAVPGGFNALSTLTPADPPIGVPFPSDVTFAGPAFSEPKLIALAYAFEQATQHRVPPASTPALPSDTVRKRH
ncbi:MAG: amidase family protein [Gammaproteobacteria bacterium]